MARHEEKQIWPAQSKPLIRGAVTKGVMKVAEFNRDRIARRRTRRIPI
jgi:hypothetical protein